MARALKSRIRIDAVSVSLALAMLVLIAPSLVFAAGTQQSSATPQATATPVHAGPETASAVVALIHEFVIASYRLVFLATSAVWDIALWISRRMIAFLANSIVNPVSGDRLLFGGAPGVSSRWAEPVLALTLLTALGILLAGPLYMSWKMWRARHNRRLHYR